MTNRLTGQIPMWHWGKTVVDNYVSASQVKLLPNAVQFRADGRWHEVAYLDSPIRWGEKRVAPSVCRCLALVDAEVRPGGGSTNSGLAVGQIAAEHKLSVQPILLDVFEAAPTLRQSCSARGVQFVSPALAPCPRNLILVKQDGGTNRIVLQSPVHMPAVDGQLRAWFVLQMRKLLASVPVGRAGCLLNNSPKSAELTRLVSHLAYRSGAHQYSVLTGSLPPTDTLRLLLSRDVASVCNLVEFSSLVDAMGLGCPRDEQASDLTRVACILVRFADTVKTGHLVVTLGCRGCLIYDCIEKAVVHVCLKPDALACVQTWVGRQAQRVNGVGDLFAGSFVIRHEFGRGAGHVVCAARDASVDAVYKLAPQAGVRASSFAVRRVVVPRHAATPVRRGISPRSELWKTF